MKDILKLKYGLGPNTVVPYLIARSGIFSSHIYRGPIHRPDAKIPFQIAALGSVEITQTAGHRLDQGDAEVFYEIVRSLFSKLHNPVRALQVEIERSNLLSGIGRSKGGKTNTLLHDSLTRLVNAEFFIDEKNGHHYPTGILRSFSYHSEGISRNILIEVDPRLVELYMNNQWVLLKKTEQAALNSPIAQALYAYYRTHQKPHPLHLATVKKLVDRTKMQETKWITQLRIALDEIKRATDWQVCEIAMSGKYIGKVVVVKKATEQWSSHGGVSKQEYKAVNDSFDI